MTPTSQKVTKLLEDWSPGDQSVPDKLMPLVYEELRRLAHRYMGRERCPIGVMGQFERVAAEANIQPRINANERGSEKEY